MRCFISVLSLRDCETKSVGVENLSFPAKALASRAFRPSDSPLRSRAFGLHPRKLEQGRVISNPTDCWGFFAFLLLCYNSRNRRLL
ncbi:hypothetical protein LMH87_006783 [Akanthomyces muscarius]|uniref:Uncharacterized protein n=1 Tax=Akanthomyces muscarius TaxID=2231603 RepID=A0A9W8QRT9_AKAMU|nr:hypothetical protein LMH87_006783 [Akanthomyces muscarius]KAJ4165137.1 hypothetical protein LMH87_006783 [Akanthomyces muscarius]